VGLLSLTGCSAMAHTRVWDSSQWHWERGVQQEAKSSQDVAASTAGWGFARRERRPVRIVESSTAENFKSEIERTKEPTLLRGMPVGPCLELWTPEHLMQHGGNKDVSVHVSTNERMDFITKNFKYHTLSFAELVRRAAYGCSNSHSQACVHADSEGTESNSSSSKHKADKGAEESPTTKGVEGNDEVLARAEPEAKAKYGSEKASPFFLQWNEKYYLRSLGEDARKSIANLETDFPDLARSISLPPLFTEEQFFSSVLRIGSAGLHLWTHYDVMDNALIQVTGRKRVVLYPPQDVDCMYMVGDKSSVLDIYITPSMLALLASDMLY
jgi:hypothetical protein